MSNTNVQAEIAALRQLKQKQQDVKMLEKRIDSFQGQIERLRKKRTDTNGLTLLPVDNAEVMEADFLHKNNTQKKTIRIVFKIVAILAILGLLAAVFLLFMEHQAFMGENQPMVKEFVDKYASNPDDPKATPIYYLMITAGIFGVVALAWTFIPGEYILVTKWFGILATLLGVIMMIWCCVFLGLLGARYGAIPAVATLLIVINQFVPWSADPADLSKRQEQQLEKARELDENNRLANQKARAKYAQELEMKQREQILDLNDQINECEDLIDILEDELAENDYLVGNQLGRLEEVLFKLESGRATSIRQALFGAGTTLETYTAEDEARDRAAARRTRDSFARQSTAMTDAHIAQKDREQADAHAQKIREIRNEQAEVIDKINEDAKYYQNR